MSVFLVKETPLNLWRQLFVTLIADDVIWPYCDVFDGTIALFVQLFFSLGRCIKQLFGVLTLFAIVDFLRRYPHCCYSCWSIEQTLLTQYWVFNAKSKKYGVKVASVRLN